MEALTRDELLRLLACAKKHRERDWLMILVAFSHGLRATEVIAMQADAVADGFLTVQRLKGSLRTVQPLVENPEPLFSEKATLIDRARKAGGKQLLFPVHRSTFWRIVQRHAKAAGIPAHKRHPHVLKHSIAMQTIHSAGIENVRQYLGHKSGASTMEYLKVSDVEASHAVGVAIKG